MKPPRFSKRTDWPLSVNKITEIREALKKEQAPVIDLTVSNPTQCGFEYPPQLLTALTDPRNLEYEPDPAGLFAAREAVGEYYRRRGFKVPPERIVLTSSTSEAYHFLFRLLADFGDHVFFPRPSYPLFSFLGDLNDITLDHYRLDAASGWRIDMTDLAATMDARCKAIVTVNPNNPTGSFLSGPELEELNGIAQAYGLALISDEVFWDYPLDEPAGDRVSLLANDRVLSFTLGGLSKTLALPQMKLSWIVLNGPAAQVEEARSRLEVMADTFLSVNTPVQRALPAWLEHLDTIQRQINGRLRDNYRFLETHTAPLKTCRLLKTRGGWYATLKLSTSRSEEDWVIKLLSKYHVFVHPGFFFDFEEEPYLVVSLLDTPERFREGALRLLGRIEQEVS